LHWEIGKKFLWQKGVKWRIIAAKIMSQSMPEKLKPLLHEKIDRMNGEQLTLVSQVLLQVEAEELADRLNEAFDKDREQGKLRRITELVKQFRAEHRYA
jgi:tRNA A37 N6-isopentenylltransferase MiaA